MEKDQPLQDSASLLPSVALQPVLSSPQQLQRHIVTLDTRSDGREMDSSCQPVPSSSQQVQCPTATRDPHTQELHSPRAVTNRLDSPCGSGLPTFMEGPQLVPRVAEQHAESCLGGLQSETQNTCSAVCLPSEMQITHHSAGPYSETQITHHAVGPFSETQVTHCPIGSPIKTQITHPVGRPSEIQVSGHPVQLPNNTQITRQSGGPPSETQITLHAGGLPSDNLFQDAQDEHRGARTHVQKHQASEVYLAGMSCRIPGAANLEEFQQGLETGQLQEGGATLGRWPESLFEVPVPVRCLNGDTRFDADFWQMNDAEASSCTPLLRFLLEVIYECVLDSGLTLTDMQSSQNKTGMYLAVSSEMDGYVTSQHYRTPFTATSSMMAVVIGGMLRTKGPAICFDANANSSLVAVHNAVTDLHRGGVHYAIVAGGNLLLNPYAALAVEQEMFQSHRKFVQSDGVAAILLVKEELSCRRIYSRVLGVGLGYSTETDPKKCDDLGAELLRQTGVDCFVNVIKEDGDQPERLGHCGPAEGLVQIIRSVLAAPNQHSAALLQLPEEDFGAVLVHSRSLGGERGCVVLKPYVNSDQHQNLSLSSMVLLPLQLRQLAGFEQVCEAITKPQCSAKMIQLMSQSLLVKDDEQPVRGYVVVSPEKEIIAKGVESSEWNPRSFALFFGDFFSSFAVDEGLYNFPAFAESMRRSDKILAEIMEENQEFVDIFKTDTYSFIQHGTMVQIALADVLKTCLHDNIVVIGAGLGTLAAAYYDGCLTRKQCLHIACCVIQTLNAWSQAEGKNYRALLVKLPRDQVYTLGPKVMVLDVYTDSLSLIGVHTKPPDSQPEQHNLPNTEDHTFDMPCEQRSPLNVGVHLAFDTALKQNSVVGDDHPVTQRNCLTADDHLKASSPVNAGVQVQSSSSLNDGVQVESSSLLNADDHLKASLSLNARKDRKPERKDDSTYLDWVTKMIKRKGGVAQEVAATPFYSPHLRPSVYDLLLHKFRRIICKPLMWSETSVCASHTGSLLSLADLRCTAESLLDGLLYPVSHPAMLRFALRDPSLVVVANLLCCDTIDVEGFDLEGDRSSCQLMELKATPLDLVTLLGELHLLGCKVDARGLNEQLNEGPADCMVPPLSPLVSWDHSREWPLPHWTELTYREKDQLWSVYKFEVEHKETEETSAVGDILYHTWYAIDSRLQGRDHVEASAVRLYNMALHCRLSSILSASPLFLHAHMGRRMFHIYNTDKLVVSGNFDSAADMDMPLPKASHPDWNSTAWLPFFRMAMDQIQGTLEGECLLQSQEFFPHEAVILPQHHLAMADEDRLEVAVEKYTGICSGGGITLKFLPCHDAAPKEDIAEHLTAVASVAAQGTSDVSLDKAWNRYVSSLVSMGTDTYEPAPEHISCDFEGEAGASSTSEQRRDSDVALSLPEDSVTPYLVIEPFMIRKDSLTKKTPTRREKMRGRGLRKSKPTKIAKRLAGGIKPEDAQMMVKQKDSPERERVYQEDGEMVNSHERNPETQNGSDDAMLAGKQNSPKRAGVCRGDVSLSATQKQNAEGTSIYRDNGKMAAAQKHSQDRARVSHGEVNMAVMEIHDPGRTRICHPDAITADMQKLNPEGKTVCYENADSVDPQKHNPQRTDVFEYTEMVVMEKPSPEGARVVSEGTKIMDTQKPTRAQDKERPLEWEPREAAERDDAGEVEDENEAVRMFEEHMNSFKGKSSSFEEACAEAICLLAECFVSSSPVWHHIEDACLEAELMERLSALSIAHDGLMRGEQLYQNLMQSGPRSARQSLACLKIHGGKDTAWKLSSLSGFHEYLYYMYWLNVQVCKATGTYLKLAQQVLQVFLKAAVVFHVKLQGWGQHLGQDYLAVEEWKNGSDQDRSAVEEGKNGSGQDHSAVEEGKNGSGQDRSAVEEGKNGSGQDRSAVEEGKNGSGQDRSAVEEGKNGSDQDHSAVEEGKNRSGQDHSAMEEGKNGSDQDHSAMEEGKNRSGQDHSAMEEDKNGSDQDPSAVEEDKNGSDQDRSAVEEGQDLSLQGSVSHTSADLDNMSSQVNALSAQDSMSQKVISSDMWSLNRGMVASVQESTNQRKGGSDQELLNQKMVESAQDLPNQKMTDSLNELVQRIAEVEKRLMMSFSDVCQQCLLMQEIYEESMDLSFEELLNCVKEHAAKDFMLMSRTMIRTLHCHLNHGDFDDELCHPTDQRQAMQYASHGASACEAEYHRAVSELHTCSDRVVHLYNDVLAGQKSADCSDFVLVRQDYLKKLDAINQLLLNSGNFGRSGNLGRRKYRLLNRIRLLKLVEDFLLPVDLPGTNGGSLPSSFRGVRTRTPADLAHGGSFNTVSTSQPINSPDVSPKQVDSQHPDSSLVDRAEAEDLSSQGMSASTDQVKVLTVEAVNVCNDIIVLLYLGTDSCSSGKVAGIWCPEYKDVHLHVPVPDSWESQNTVMLLYMLTAVYVIEQAELRTGETVLIHPPWGPLSLSVLLALNGSQDKVKVVALTSKYSTYLVHHLCPDIPCQEVEGDWTLMADTPGGRHGTTHIKLSEEGVPFTLNKLPTSAHLILCGMPANCTDVLPSVQTNATVTFINLQKAVREMLEWLRRDVESATTVVQQLTNYLPGGKTIEMILKTNTPACLGSGFKRLGTHEFQGQVTLTDVLMVLQSPPGDLPSLLQDTFKDDLDFFDVLHHSLFILPAGEGRLKSEAEHANKYKKCEDGRRDQGFMETEQTSTQETDTHTPYEPLQITLAANLDRKVVVKTSRSRELPANKGEFSPQTTQLPKDRKEQANQRKEEATEHAGLNTLKHSLLFKPLREREKQSEKVSEQSVKEATQATQLSEDGREGFLPTREESAVQRREWMKWHAQPFMSTLPWRESTNWCKEANEQRMEQETEAAQPSKGRRAQLTRWRESLVQRWITQSRKLPGISRRAQITEALQLLRESGEQFADGRDLSSQKGKQQSTQKIEQTAQRPLSRDRREWSAPSIQKTQLSTERELSLQKREQPSWRMEQSAQKTQLTAEREFSSQKREQFTHRIEQFTQKTQLSTEKEFSSQRREQPTQLSTEKELSSMEREQSLQRMERSTQKAQLCTGRELSSQRMEQSTQKTQTSTEREFSSQRREWSAQKTKQFTDTDFPMERRAPSAQGGEMLQQKMQLLKEREEPWTQGEEPLVRTNHQGTQTSWVDGDENTDDSFMGISGTDDALEADNSESQELDSSASFIKSVSLVFHAKPPHQPQDIATAESSEKKKASGLHSNGNDDTDRHPSDSAAQSSPLNLGQPVPESGKWGSAGSSASIETKHAFSGVTDQHASSTPLLHYLGNTYWETCPSDCETQEARYFETVKNQVEEKPVVSEMIRNPRDWSFPEWGNRHRSFLGLDVSSSSAVKCQEGGKNKDDLGGNPGQRAEEKWLVFEDNWADPSTRECRKQDKKTETATQELQSLSDSTEDGKVLYKPQSQGQPEDAMKNKDHLTESRTEGKEPIFKDDWADSPAWEDKKQQKSESPGLEHHSWPGSARHGTRTEFSPVEYSLFESSLSPECHSIDAWRDWTEPRSYANILRKSRPLLTASVAHTLPKRHKIRVSRDVGFVHSTGFFRTQSKHSPTENSPEEGSPVEPVEILGDTRGQSKWSSSTSAAKKYSVCKHGKESKTLASGVSDHRGILPGEKLQCCCHRCRKGSKPHSKPRKLSAGDIVLDVATCMEKRDCPSLKQTSFNTGLVRRANYSPVKTMKLKSRSKKLSTKFQDADVTTAAESGEHWDSEDGCLSADVVKEKVCAVKKTTKPPPKASELSTENKVVDVARGTERKEQSDLRDASFNGDLEAEKVSTLETAEPQPKPKKLTSGVRRADLTKCKVKEEHSETKGSSFNIYPGKEKFRDAKKSTKFVGRKVSPQESSDLTDCLHDVDSDWRWEADQLIIGRELEELQTSPKLHFSYLPEKETVLLHGDPTGQAEVKPDLSLDSTDLEPSSCLDSDTTFQKIDSLHSKPRKTELTKGLYFEDISGLVDDDLTRKSPVLVENFDDHNRTITGSHLELDGSNVGGWPEPDTFLMVQAHNYITGIIQMAQAQLNLEMKDTWRPIISASPKLDWELGSGETRVFRSSTPVTVKGWIGFRSREGGDLFDRVESATSTSLTESPGQRHGADRSRNPRNSDVPPSQMMDSLSTTRETNSKTEDDVHTKKSMTFAESMDGRVDLNSSSQSKPSTSVNRRNADGEDKEARDRQGRGGLPVLDMKQVKDYVIHIIQMAQAQFMSLTNTWRSHSSSLSQQGWECAFEKIEVFRNTPKKDGETEDDEESSGTSSDDEADPESTAPLQGYDVTREMRALSLGGSLQSPAESPPVPCPMPFEWRDSDEDLEATASQAEITDQMIFEMDDVLQGHPSAQKDDQEMIFEMDDLPHMDQRAADELPELPLLGRVPSLPPNFVFPQPPRPRHSPPHQPLPNLDFLKWDLPFLSAQSPKGASPQQTDFTQEPPTVEAPSMRSPTQKETSSPVPIPGPSSSASKSMGSAVPRGTGSSFSASAIEQSPVGSTSRKGSSSPIPIPGRYLSPQSPSVISATHRVCGSRLPAIFPEFPPLGTSPSSVSPISLMCRASLFQDDARRIVCVTSPPRPRSMAEFRRQDSDRNTAPLESASGSRHQEHDDSNDSDTLTVDIDSGRPTESDNDKDSHLSESDEETDSRGQGLGSIEQMRAGHDVELSFYDISLSSVDCSVLTRRESCSDWDSLQALGEGHSPRKSLPQRQDVSLTALPGDALLPEMLTAAPPQMDQELLTVSPPQMNRELLTMCPPQVDQELLTVSPPQMNREQLTISPPQADQELLTTFPPKISQVSTVALPQIDQELLTMSPPQMNRELLTISSPQMNQVLLTVSAPQMDKGLLTVAPPEMDMELLTVAPPQVDTNLLTVAPPLVDITSISPTKMHTPVMGAGSGATLTVPATPVPHMRRSSYVMGGGGMSTSVGVSSQSCSPSSTSAHASTETRHRKTSITELSTVKFVASLSSPLFETTWMRPGTTTPPSRAPAQPFATIEDPAAKDVQEVSDLLQPSNLATSSHCVPGEVATPQTADKEGVEFQQTVIPPCEIMFIRSQSLPSSTPEAGDSSDTVQSVLSKSKDRVPVYAGKERKFFLPPQLSETKYEASPAESEARVERVIIAENKSHSAGHTLRSSLFKGVDLECTGRPDHQEKKQLASKELKAKWDVAGKGDGREHSEGSVNLKKTKVQAEQETVMAIDRKEMKVAVDQKEVIRLLAVDQEETVVAVGQKQMKVTSFQRETSVTDTKMMADQKETKVADDRKDLRRRFVKKSSTPAFIFNASEHLKKLFKSRLTPIKDSAGPATPLAPSQDRARPATPLAPSQDRARPATPLAPSQDRARPATQLASSQDRARPATQLAPSQDRARPGTPQMPPQDRAGPATQLAPSQDSARPATLQTFSQDKARPGTPLAPSQDKARPGTPLAPSQDKARPGTPLAPSQDRARPDITVRIFVEQSTSESEDVEDDTAQVCKVKKFDEAVTSFQVGGPQEDLAHEKAVGSIESATHKLELTKDGAEKTLTDAKRCGTFGRRRKFGVMIARFEAEKLADGKNSKDSASLPPQICAPLKGNQQISAGDLTTINATTAQAATEDAERSPKPNTLCPHQSVKLDVHTERRQCDQPPRKVSVVNTNRRKLTPYCPGVQGLLTSTVMQSVLERLAPLKGKSAIARPLYIVHPITGMVEILRELAAGLDVRCFGIKKTNHAPDFSVETLAKFYCQAITQQDSFGSYRLAGYSYGGMVAFEMARQLQREGKKVELLLMLDGSPDYVKTQTQFPQRNLPPDSSPQHRMAVVEAHFLLHFMSMYGPVQQRALVQAMLEEQETQEDRVEAAVGITMGTVQVSSSMARGRWLGLKSKVEMMKRSQRPKVSVGHVANDIISLKRQQKAIKFLQAAYIADRYDVSEGELYQGDIHLVRIKSTPEYSCLLPADYLLSRLCTGAVLIHYVDGGHESMMQLPQVKSLIAAVQTLLRSGNT